MSKIKFEKFEMKYSYFLPAEYKEIMYKFGGDTQFGSCRFEYIDNIINNLVRIPCEMDFHIIPFGDIGNGDYFCFYRYGSSPEEYYVGIWLHETNNFVILASNFKSFMYKCLLDDFLSTVVPNEELSISERQLAFNESLERCEALSRIFDFDLDKVKKMKNEFDYHRLMVEYDEGSLQSLCYIGKYLIKRKDIRGFEFLEDAIKRCSFYTAPYYIVARAMLSIGRSGKDYFQKALKTSLILTGYSYWQEDYLEIPEDVHREIALFIDRFLKDSDDYLERSLYYGRDPYDYKLRVELARQLVEDNRFEEAMIEYNNAIFSLDDRGECKKILKEALAAAQKGKIYYLMGIIEHDIKLIR